MVVTTEGFLEVAIIKSWHEQDFIYIYIYILYIIYYIHILYIPAIKMLSMPTV